MIYVANDTNKPAKLKAQTIDGENILSVVIGGDEFMILHASADSEYGRVMLDRYKEGEKINHKISRHDIWLNGARVLFSKTLPVKENEEPTGYDGSIEPVVVVDGEELPEKYTTSRDIIVVLHNADDDVTMSNENLLFEEAGLTIQNEQSTIHAEILPIKWYNWVSLKEKVYIYKNGNPMYRLCYRNHPTKEGVRQNTLRYAHTTKKPQQEETEEK